ncbi:MAG: sigma-70 family RNA polymerase sigma factor [Anaerococcus sp.]|nr:sigma-70 family RNA polymerase sigma factor [Anaerococcus sp.]
MNIKDDAQRLMKAYRPLLISLVKKYGAYEEDEAMDVARMILIDSIEIYDEKKGTFGNFLKLRLNYYFLDLGKKPRVSSLYEKNPAGEEMIDLLEEPSDMEKEFYIKNRNDLLMTYVNRLDELDRMIIIGKFFDRLTNKKLGQELNISPKTVANRQSLALAKLRRMMDRRDFDL